MDLVFYRAGCNASGCYGYCQGSLPTLCPVCSPVPAGHRQIGQFRAGVQPRMDQLPLTGWDPGTCWEKEKGPAVDLA